MVELVQSSTIYVKFDDSKAGNSLKDRLLGELKECLPITARAKRFQLKKGKSTIADRKQFPLILGHAITIHKSHGSSLAYM